VVIVDSVRAQSEESRKTIRKILKVKQNLLNMLDLKLSLKVINNLALSV